MRMVAPVFVGTLALACMACLQSPLLDHANASDPAATGTGKKEASIEQADPESCPVLFAQEKLCASLTWDRVPTDEETGQLTTRFWKKDEGTEHGPYVDPRDLTVAIKLWMPSMGHGSSPVKVTHAIDASGTAIPGVFVATDVYFSMPGKWEIWIQLKRERQLIEQGKVDFQF